MAIEAAIQFRDFLPFEQFEGNLSFASLRAKIHREYLEYENSGKDDDSDPENHFISEYAVQTILNEHAEVKIGNSIYKMYPSGYIRIIDGSIATLLILRQTTATAHLMQNVEIVGNVNSNVPSPIICEGHKSKRDQYTSGGKRIKWRIAIQTYPWSRYVIAESTNYIKKNNKWKKFRCHTKCRVWGDISDYQTLNDGTKVANCDKSLTFNTQNGVFSDKYNVKHWQHKIHVSTRTSSGWVKGYHYSFIGSTTEYKSTLTF